MKRGRMIVKHDKEKGSVMIWKVVLALRTCNVLFMSASYTMSIPFLPM